MKKVLVFILTVSLIFTALFAVQAPAQASPSEGTRLAGITIGIDPGHQKKANYQKEALAPGSKVMKAKVSAGTQGRYTRVPEYVVNLQVALKLKALLEKEGARVVMTRTTNEVNISNKERAVLFNNEKVDLGIRLHCNGSSNKKVYGAFMLIPSKSPHAADCKTAAKCVLDEYIKATKTKNLGVTKRSDQTGFNWCTQTIINIEMGHMTNKAEDKNLVSSSYQDKMADGLFKGICKYFGK
jgi:N-acetylmuramoyl-L-alanine amidase